MGPTGPTGTFLIGKRIKPQKTLQYDNKIYHITWNTALWRLWAVFSYIINDKKSAKEKSIGNLKKLKKDEGAKRVQQKDRRRNAGLGRNYRRTQMCSFGTGPEGSSSLARYSFTLP